jgi:prevent-host-death family protein
LPKAADKLLAVPLTRLQGLPAFTQLAIVAKMVIMDSSMKFMSAKDAKNEFGLLLDTARAEPVTIEKHGRPVVVVLAVEAFGRLTAEQAPGAGATKMVSLPRRPDRAAKRKLTT